MELREIFDNVIAQQDDPNTIARLEVCREYFTNEEFRAALEAHIFAINQREAA